LERLDKHWDIADRTSFATLALQEKPGRAAICGKQAVIIASVFCSCRLAASSRSRHKGWQGHGARRGQELYVLGVFCALLLTGASVKHLVSPLLLLLLLIQLH
jgi:hypothetical protein